MHKKRYSFWNDGDKGEQGDGKCKTTFIEQKSSDSSHSGYRITLYWWNVQGHQALRNAGVWTDNWNTAVLCHTHDCWTLDTWYAWLLNFGHVTRMIVELWTRERNVEHVRGFFPRPLECERERFEWSVWRESERRRSVLLKARFYETFERFYYPVFRQVNWEMGFFLSANWELKIYCRLTNWNCDLKLSWNIKQMEF